MFIWFRKSKHQFYININPRGSSVKKIRGTFFLNYVVSASQSECAYNINFSISPVSFP